MDSHIKTQEWEQIIAILRTRKDIKTRNESKLRRFIEAIWYRARSGCQAFMVHGGLCHAPAILVHPSVN